MAGFAFSVYKRRHMRTPILATFLGLALFGACRSDNPTNVDGSTNPGDGKNPTDGTMTGPVMIQDVQNDSMPPGTAVTLSGVVVTAIDAYGAKTGDIWVEEPSGGAFSGVHVFGAPTATVAALKVGDIVDISGAQKSEFALSTDTSGNTETELEAGPNGMTVTKTGSGSAPAPMVVDALAIGQMATPAARAAEWEKWEGVLITVKNVSALQTPKCVGTACTDMTLQSFNVTGALAVESSLTAMPTGIKLHDCFASVTGVESYFFNNLLYPTQASDIATGGTGCPAAEAAAGTSPGTCADSIDNDGNGFTDCMDLGCEVGASAWLGATCTSADAMCGCSTNYATNSATTINGLAALPTTPVLLHNVYVTGTGKSGFYVADALQAASNGGLFVFTSSTPITVTAGQKLATLQGTITAFNSSKLTTGFQSTIEITNATAGTASAGGVVLPVASTAAVVGSLTAGKPFASSLVQLTNVKVKAAANTFGQVQLVDNSNNTIYMDDDAFQYYGGTMAAPNSPAVGTCYTTITGFLDLTTTDSAGMMQVRTINPRSATDMVAGAACTGM